MVICFFTPNPPSFFVCVCLFYVHAVKTTQVYFSISGFNTWGLATLCSHQDRVAWLAAHCRSSSPCPCFVGRFKKCMWCDHGLKVGENTHTLSRSGPTFVQKLCKTRKCICPLLVQRHRWAFAAGRSTSPALQWLQSDHRRCVIYTSCFIVKLPIRALPSVSFLFQGV